MKRTRHLILGPEPPKTANFWVSQPPLWKISVLKMAVDIPNKGPFLPDFEANVGLFDAAGP